ncbi:predicted protein [Postia placenta Mad-698-R]|nr:predicted protein [Postia placenta Mad-698-R]
MSLQSPTELTQQISCLRHYLTKLPLSLPYKTVPESCLASFCIDPEWEADVGKWGAVNRALEVRLGPQTGPGDTFILNERGPGIESLPDILSSYMPEFSESPLFQKWINDCCRAAEMAYKVAGQQVPPPVATQDTQDASKSLTSVLGKRKGAEKQAGGQKAKVQAIKNKVAKAETKILTDFTDTAFIDSDEEPDTRVGDLRHEVVVLTAAKSNAKLLKTQRDLTLSFDGGKTWKLKGVYTIHISTPERWVFLMDLNDASHVSHTANYIVEILQEIIAGVGAERFSGIVSDNTGNTRKAWQLIRMMFTHIFNMQDSCHEMNLALGQISELPEFKDVRTSLPYYVITLVISDMRAILAFMNKSTYTMEHFNDACKSLNITIGLAAIGDTRFATLTWTAISVRECLPAFRKIVAQLTSPYAKVIKCLKSSLSTASDVFVFWLGIIAQLHDLFIHNRAHLEMSTISDVRAITNQRYKGMIDDGSEDIYITAFFLDPYIKATEEHLSPSHPASIHSRYHPSGYHYHSPLLTRNEYGNLVDAKPDEICTRMQLRNPRLANLTPGAALNALKSELKAYAKKRNPFFWWVKMQQDDDAHILGALAIKLYSVVPNSMADERTMSMITWLNSACRSKQDVRTLQDYIKIRQWYRWDPQSTKKALTVSWHDMDETIRAPSWHTEQAQDSECGPDIPSSPISVDLLEDVPDYKDEHRDKFVVSDLVDLNVPFLKEILADEHPKVPCPRDKVRVEHASKASSSDGPLDWDKW